MIEGWVTRDANSVLQPMQPVAFSRSSPQEALPTIDVDDSRTFQPIEGFGFALTGGSAYLLAGLPAADRAELLEELFGLTEDAVGLSCLRLSIGASDLGWRDFTYWDLEPGTADPDLARFNLAVCDPEVVPVMQQILRINPAVKIIAISGGGRTLGPGQLYLESARLFGAKRILAKPFNMAALLTAVTDVLAGN